MEHERLLGRPRLRARRIEAEFRCTAEQKQQLRRLADMLNTSIGALLDEYAQHKFGSRVDVNPGKMVA